jgi:hypothetical protein
MNCPHCRAVLPNDAHFCVECGNDVNQPVTGPTVNLQAHQWDTQCPACAAVNPDVVSFCLNCGQKLPTQKSALHATTPLAKTSSYATLSAQEIRLVMAGVLLIGLLFLFFTRSIFPGLVVLFGIIAIIGAMLSRSFWVRAYGLAWFVGALILAANPRIILQGLLVLLLISLALHLLFKPHQRGW